MTSHASVEIFERERGRLFGLAYRMLGSVVDAEDAVQDAWLRWQGAAEPAGSPAAWLTTTVTRLAIDRLRRRRDEPYEGPWLPEPLLTEDPDLLERLQDLTQATLLILERLTPEERTTFVLREVLGDDYRTIGAVLGVRENTCRQYYRRARQRLRGGPRFDPPDPARQRQVLTGLLTALQRQDREALRAAMQEDAVALHDGGGVVSAAIRPIEGAQRIAQVYLHLYGGLMNRSRSGLELRPVMLAGEAALAALINGGLDTVTTLTLRDGVLAQLLSVRNPVKLARFADALKVPLTAGQSASMRSTSSRKAPSRPS